MSHDDSTPASPPERQRGAGRRVLSDVVAEWIAARVLDGTYPTGERLPPERDLAEQLGVNRSSVREALKRLEQLRLVSIQQGSGIRACPTDHANLDLVAWLLLRDGRPDPVRIRELTELRNVVFQGLIRLAIERSTQAELDEVAAITHRIVDPALTEQQAWVELEQGYDAVVRLTRNGIALLLWNSMRRFVSEPPVFAAREASVRARLEVVAPMRRLAVAIAARDADTAARALREVHAQLLERVAAHLASALPPSGSRDR